MRRPLFLSIGDLEQKCGFYGEGRLALNVREILTLTGQSSRSRTGRPSALSTVRVAVSRYWPGRKPSGTCADISCVRSPGEMGMPIAANAWSMCRGRHTNAVRLSKPYPTPARSGHLPWLTIV
jgi:hypothetical protein